MTETNSDRGTDERWYVLSPPGDVSSETRSIADRLDGLEGTPIGRSSSPSRSEPRLSGLTSVGAVPAERLPVVDPSEPVRRAVDYGAR